MMKCSIALMLSIGFHSVLLSQVTANQMLPRSVAPRQSQTDGNRSQRPAQQHLSGHFDLNVGIGQFPLDDLSTLSPENHSLKVSYEVLYDEKEHLTIKIRPEKPAGIFVHLVDPKGKSMSHARHQLTRQGNELHAFFTLKQLPPGTYYVQFVDAEGHPIHQVSIRKN